MRRGAWVDVGNRLNYREAIVHYLWPAGNDVGLDVLAAPNMLGVPRSIQNGVTALTPNGLYL